MTTKTMEEGEREERRPRRRLIPEEPEDLWQAYNLISVGDNVMAVTVRKILRETASGGRDAQRVKLKLEIIVEILLQVLI
ncbi:hypothetical protein QJS10_CPB15g01893 [Acorus calamus]|uniref:Pelota N-terminal domain-containing protein n=1 Tax=Acorus calamus TaxID=4465 RepID=A0AAV9D550_ACOCL|nr:hypothetical protein QJS10_CPB15g01893 [Acorus calamus]